MKRTIIITTLFTCMCIAGLVLFSPAETRSITVPKGTKIIKIGPGHYKFTMPGQIVEVIDLNIKKGTFSRLAVMSKSSRPTLIWGGRNGRIVTVKRDYNRISEKKDLIESGYSDDVELPLTLTINEPNSEDLTSEFLKLNLNDPSNNSGSGSVGTTIDEIRCKADNGTWNPLTKRCE